MIPYKFEGAASALYSAYETRKIIEHENGGYKAWVFKEYIGNSILWACYKVTQ